MKKFMKGLLATTMVFAMMTSLVGCGGGSEAEAPAEATDTLVMATNAAFPPYEYYEGEAIVGIDAEIAAAIAEKLGMEFKIEDMEFDAIIPAVTSGKVSFGMAGMTVTEERLKSVDFSTSYAQGVQVVIVKEGSEIVDVDHLFAGDDTHVIGVQTGTTGDLYSTWDLEDAGLATIERFNKGGDAVLALTQGKVDCVVIDNEPAKEFVAANEGLTILDTEYAVEDYAMCFAKDSELTAAVNGALEELIADGTVQAIIDKYISAE
ncbi:MAG: transporter substrate-binding domain-containing protein [Anaerotignum sp.]|nr:transporter substrate-binding domain-containing protein [Anaerotignum sp.]